MRILIVEDEFLIAMALERILASSGHEVVGRTATCEGAIMLAREKAPDLVLLDIRLRGSGDGLEAAAEIRRRDSGVAIGFLTAEDGSAARARATEVGAIGYLTKPIDRTALLALVDSAAG